MNIKLVPRIIAVLGLIGYATMFIGLLLDIFGYNVGMIIFLPGGLFELILPLWLIVKGFNTLPIDSESAKSGLIQKKISTAQA